MRIVVSANELDSLAWSSVVLDTTGIPRTKCSYQRGWVHGGKSPLTSAELADGRPMIVLYDAGDPRASLRAVEDLAELITTGQREVVELLPYLDFAVCWNRQHRHHPDHLLEVS